MKLLNRSHGITDRMMMMMMMRRMSTTITILVPFNLYSAMKLYISDNTSLVENELPYSKSTSWLY